MAVISMASVVVLPPPRLPAVTKKQGRSGSNERSIIVKAAAISVHLPT
jgi:hypothetical protein